MITKEVYEYTHGYRPGTGKNQTSDQTLQKRIDKAITEEEKSTKTIEEIIDYVKEFLSMYAGNYDYNPICFEVDASPFIEEKTETGKRLKNTFNLFDDRHLVWIKFAIKDNKRHIGSVAAGNDINFEMNLLSGKIISELGYAWDEEKILICPLPNIGMGERDDIECGIGNYLIEKGVPILDYYSHRYH